MAGSQKQADTLIALNNRALRRRGEPPFSPEQEAKARAFILAADLPTIRGLFDEVNADLGFDRKTSPPTPEQLAVLRRLEQRAGIPRTTFRDGLSFDDAHRRIESLKRSA